MPDLAEFLRTREERFRRSPERQQFILSVDQWRAAIRHAIEGDPATVSRPLHSDRELGSGMSLGNGILLRSGDDRGIEKFASTVAVQANALLPEPVWSPGRISREFTYFRDPNSGEQYILIAGLEETLAKQAYPPLVGLGG